jgi:5-methyltetrahydrofolate--homocysteine methyltransferase
MKGREGADELTRRALEQGMKPDELLSKALIAGMNVVGQKFAQNKVFVPDVLMAAKAMYAAMAHLRPFFLSGEVKRRGVMCIGTVAGDLHDIGKNLVAMIVEGGGWEIVDLGVDVPAARFLEAVEKHPGCAVGLSTLLTTTMANMEKITRAVKDRYPGTKVCIGGAPITAQFAQKIGADCYSPNPQGAVDFLNSPAA